MLSFLFILLFSIIIICGLNRFNFMFSGRKGFRLFQPLLELSKLFSKGSVYSNSSSLISQLVAPLYLSSIIIASLCIPVGIYPSLISFNGDIILFSYLISFSRFFLIIASIDSGDSSLQSLGTTRLGRLNVLIEPAFFLLMGTLSLVTGQYSFDSMFSEFNNQSINMFVISIVVAYGLFKLAMAECDRAPIGSAESKTQLNMINRLLTLEMSGIDLAFVKIASWLKLSIYGVLIVNILIPFSADYWFFTNPWLSIFIFIAAIKFYTLSIGMLDYFSIQNKMNKNYVYLLTIITISILSFIIAHIIINNSLI